MEILSKIMEVITFSSTELNWRKENSYFNIAEKAENILGEKLHTPADRNTGRQTDRQTRRPDRQTERQTRRPDRQTHRQTLRPTDTHTDIHTYRPTDRHTDRQTYIQTGRQVCMKSSMHIQVD